MSTTVNEAYAGALRQINALIREHRAEVERLTQERDEARRGWRAAEVNYTITLRERNSETSRAGALKAELDGARAALHEHREATDEMARKHKEEIERMEREHGDDSRHMDAVCGALGNCPSDGAAHRVRRLQESNAWQAKRIAELERDVGEHAAELLAAREDARAARAEVAKLKGSNRDWDRMLDDLDAARSEVAKLKADLAARPVVESETVTRLREVCVALNRGGKDLSMADFHAALNAFLASAPPAALPVREVVVESKEAAALRVEFDGMNLNYDGVMFLKRHLEALRAFLASSPPVAAPAPSEPRVTGSERQQMSARILELETALAAEREAHASTRLGYERSEADLEAEIAALKSAAPSERAVDRELREALRDCPTVPDASCWLAASEKRLARALSAWLSAPLAADEYVSAAVASSELAIRCTHEPFNTDLRQQADAAWSRLRALYDARKRGGADQLRDATKKVEPAVEESTFDSKAVPYLDPDKFIAAPSRDPLDIAARELAEAAAVYLSCAKDHVQGESPKRKAWVDAHNRYLALRNAGGDKNTAAQESVSLVCDAEGAGATAQAETPAPPSPRETVYVPVYADGDAGRVYTESQKEVYGDLGVSYWLTFDAERLEIPQ